MGTDKSTLVYYQKPQRYHVYEMLNNICNRVFISCNSLQAMDMSNAYEFLVDLPCYNNIGPMAALLTAFSHYPDENFLVVGCDYPFVSGKDLEKFLNAVDDGNTAAFYNEKEKLYEPLLALYRNTAVEPMMKLFEKKQYSLQYFLKMNEAEKYYPADETIMKSVDTLADFELAKRSLANKNYMREEVHGQASSPARDDAL